MRGQYFCSGDSLLSPVSGCRNPAKARFDRGLTTSSCWLPSSSSLPSTSSSSSLVSIGRTPSGNVAAWGR